MDSDTKLELLNARFSGGGEPVDFLDQAGVLLRTFDALEHPERPWEPCPARYEGKGFWCAGWRDRFAVSLVNRKHTAIYSHGSPGMIIDPGMVKVLCMYYSDGSSQGKTCEPPGVSADCVPGCGPWCASERSWGCSWKPPQLRHMMSQHDHVHPENYNEVILDADEWVNNLPDTVLAFFVLPDSGPEAQERVRTRHRAFLEQYGLMDATLPLLVYDVNRIDAPFRHLYKDRQMRLLQASGNANLNSSNERLVVE